MKYITVLLGLALTSCVSAQKRVDPLSVTERYVLTTLTSETAYTIEHSPEATVIITEEFSKLPNNVVQVRRTRSRVLTATEWTNLKLLLEKGFWHHNTIPYSGYDGVTYILIGQKGSNSRRLERWFPIDRPEELPFLTLVHAIKTYAAKQSAAANL